MKRTDFLIVFVLWMLAIAIYLPVSYTEYFYTDEAVQLWNYKEGSGFHMFIIQGRYITDLMFDYLFGKANKFSDIKFIRIFSLCGWLLSIPVWYYIIRKISIKEGLPGLLAGISVLFLICTPVFSISITWASCLELFLANTAGFLAGYCVYASISYEEKRIKVAGAGVFMGLLLGIISCFTYQNGFGCFLLPFLLHLLKNPGKWRVVIIGAAGYLFICLVYYLLFKYQLKSGHIPGSERTSIHINVIEKLKFFIGRPMAGAFHFTYLFNEKNIAGLVASLVLAGSTIAVYWKKMAVISLPKRLKQLLFIFSLLLLIYLPGLIVKENYASNRTMLALNMGVWFFVAITVPHLLKDKKKLILAGGLAGVLFISNALYNLHVQFLKPVTKEYTQIRSLIEEEYKPGIDTIYFIRPQENTFVKKYGITRSWDEFGVPSTFFNWVPEFFVKQVVFEKTGDRALANRLIIKSWPAYADYLQSGEYSSTAGLVINAQEMLDRP